MIFILLNTFTHQNAILENYIGDNIIITMRVN